MRRRGVRSMSAVTAVAYRFRGLSRIFLALTSANDGLQRVLLQKTQLSLPIQVLYNQTLVDRLNIPCYTKPTTHIPFV